MAEQVDWNQSRDFLLFGTGSPNQGTDVHCLSSLPVAFHLLPSIYVTSLMIDITLSASFLFLFLSLNNLVWAAVARQRDWVDSARARPTLPHFFFVFKMSWLSRRKKSSVSIPALCFLTLEKKIRIYTGRSLPWETRRWTEDLVDSTVPKRVSPSITLTLISNKCVRAYILAPTVRRPIRPSAFLINKSRLRRQSTCILAFWLRFLHYIFSIDLLLIFLKRAAQNCRRFPLGVGLVQS